MTDEGNRMNISLHIERLIVEGLPLTGDQRGLLHAAIEAELARLLAAGSLAPGLQDGAAIPRLAGGAIQWERDSNPADMGAQIAQAVYTGIGPSHE